ncbi:conserved hypothetical protein [Pediculus humanus corporis]|uniref:CRC domain-containing protein n=1 Tax=Pediculus humanus subsp. corporis TaxID=121224 RepID=E0VW04_PEDHC|nr:uncharacterized protein Phum_PHUM472540 [Pediculus humanus corporis]EEB17560.1 conserved hypothetical protein [Pediculus humanus corporis]
MPPPEDIQGNEHFDENEQFITPENVDCTYKNDITMDNYENEDNFQEDHEASSSIVGSAIDGNSEIAFISVNNSEFEEPEPMDTETNQQSSQESFFPLPCEKRNIKDSNILGTESMITESDDGFESYENEMLQSVSEENNIKSNMLANENVQFEKTFYYKQPVEEQVEEGTVVHEEYFQEEQSEAADNQNFSRESVFGETSFQGVEYNASEQVIETTESEIPTEYINETVESIQSIVEEGSDDTKPYETKGKIIISKDNILQLNQSNVNLKKFVSDNIRTVPSTLKRPLIPGPGQAKNMFTKVIIQGNTSSNSSSNQPFKIIGSGSSLVSGQTRSISFAQAQQIGLLPSGAKIQQIIPSCSTGNVTSPKRMIYKKIVPTCSSSLLTPSNAAKSPTKILPAPSPSKGSNIRPSLTTVKGSVSVGNIQTLRGNVPIATLKTIQTIPNTNRPIPVAAITALRQSGISNVIKPVGTIKNLPGPQKVIIRQGQIPLKGGTIINPSSTGQVIRIPTNANTLQPVQIGGGKQVQYFRFVSGSGSTLPSTVINNTKSKIVKAPVGTTAFKAIPIAPNPNSVNVKAVLPKPSGSVTNASSNTKRILIPVSQGMSQLCIANDVTNASEEGNCDKMQTITTVPVTALQQLKNTGSITAIPSSAVTQLRQGRNITTLTNSQFAQLKTGQGSSIQLKPGESIIPVSAVNQTNSDGSFVVSEGSIVMLPAEIVHQIQNNDSANRENITENFEGKMKPTPDNDMNEEDSFEKDHLDSDGCRSNSPNRVLEANGIRMKKPCNCTRSQCLKLYCECFANGEFCFQCNCNNCYNNIEHEEARQKSIKSCLERNPCAFRPKIQIGETEEDERRHNKGCHCKRSGCLKNYCECYEAKITCSKSCKCIGCRNTEEFLEGTRSSLIELADAAEETFNSEQKSDFIIRPQSTGSTMKQPYNFMSSEVVEATCQCLLAQAEESERNGLSTEEGERLIIEEFGRCLIQIIGCSNLDDGTIR